MTKTKQNKISKGGDVMTEEQLYSNICQSISKSLNYNHIVYNSKTIQIDKWIHTYALKEQDVKDIHELMVITGDYRFKIHTRCNITISILYEPRYEMYNVALIDKYHNLVRLDYKAKDYTENFSDNVVYLETVSEILDIINYIIKLPSVTWHYHNNLWWINSIK